MRRIAPSTNPAPPESAADFVAPDWSDLDLMAEDTTETAILLRMSTALKSALTVEAGKQTAATGSRVSVNALVRQMITKALSDIAKAEDASA